MKPRLVFVHGIGGLRDPVAEQDSWLSALAAGACDAGHERWAPELRHGRATDTRFAYYGNLFHRDQKQGDDGDGADDADLVGELLLAAVDERLSEPTTEDTWRVLRRARAQLAPEGSPQGPGAAARQVLTAANTLLGLPGLSAFGRWASAGLMVGQLRQVARYLRRGEEDERGLTLDSRIRRCIEQALDSSGPTIVIAHSLGTVVSMETLHGYRGDLRLLITLGSPIGMGAAVRPRMRPQPLRVPDSVERWLNFWDRDDLVAARPRLENSLLPSGTGVLPVTMRVDSDGMWVHPATKYLAHAAVAGPVAEAIQRATTG
ncbi:alpha/beta hydrolase family protein [Streptomyces siamensis]